MAEAGTQTDLTSADVQRLLDLKQEFIHNKLNLLRRELVFIRARTPAPETKVVARPAEPPIRKRAPRRPKRDESA